MANETKTLAEYVAAVRFEDLPDAVIQRTKDHAIFTIPAASAMHRKAATA